MQLTIDSDEPIDRVLAVVGSLYGVRLAVDPEGKDPKDEDQGVTMPRH